MKDLDQSPTGGDNLAEQVTTLMAIMLRWKPEIESAMHHVYGMYSFNDVVAMVLTQQVQLYEYHNCIILMQVNKFPQFSAYHCFLACGDMQGIKDAEPELNEIAKKLQCKFLSISGRTGWTRALKADGWDHALSTLFKETY